MTNPAAIQHQDETVNDFVVDAFDTVVIALTGFLALFAINGLLNIAWSALFFRVHRLDWALLEVVLLWWGKWVGAWRSWSVAAYPHSWTAVDSGHPA